MTFSKQGQTGYFELTGNSQSFAFSPTNSFGTGSNVLSISDNVATIRNTLILQDGSNKTIFTQSGANMIISGGIKFESNTSVDNILVSNITTTNAYADYIGATGIVASTIRTNYIGVTGIVATNITGTNISADYIGATGIVASTIRTNYIGVTGIVATNITGTNISADYIGATGIVASTIRTNYIGVSGIVATNITGTNISADYIGATGIVASTIRTNYIGATGIVATNITGTNISADYIGATGIVASTIRTNYIGVSGIVATNITGTNISADYIGATGIVASTMKCSATASADNDVVNKLYCDGKITDLINGATGTLDTLKELATAINNDSGFSQTITDKINGKASLFATQTITGQNTLSNTSNVYYGSGANLANITSDKLTTATMSGSGAFYLPWIKSFDGSSNLTPYSTGNIKYDFTNGIVSVPNLLNKGNYQPSFSLIDNSFNSGVRIMAANNGSSYIDVSYGSLSVRKDGSNATTWATFGPSGLTVFGAITGTSIIASGLISAQNGLTVSGGNLTVNSGTLTVAGALNANNGLVVSGAVLTANSGLTVAFGVLTASAGLTVDNGVLTASAGLTVSSGTITVSSGNLTVSGSITASGLITANNGLTVPAGQFITANGGITATSITASGLITANNGLTVPAGKFITANGGITATSITASGLITANNGLTVPAGQFITANGGITATSITASGLITANNGLTVPAGQFITANGGITATSITASGLITANNGLTVPAGTLTISSITAISPVLYLNAVKEVAGDATFYYSSSTLTVGSVNTSSDYRIKQNVQPITGNIDELKPVSYYNTLTKRQDLGFIAHEVQQHFPMLVSGEKDGAVNQSINYSGLIPLLVAEIQELKTEVKVLKEQMQQMYRLV
jgi:hypothetical protein